MFDRIITCLLASIIEPNVRLQMGWVKFFVSPWDLQEEKLTLTRCFPFNDNVSAHMRANVSNMECLYVYKNKYMLFIEEPNP